MSLMKEVVVADVFGRRYELYISRAFTDSIILKNPDVVSPKAIKITNPIQLTAEIKYGDTTASGGTDSTTISVYNLRDETIATIGIKSYLLLKAGYDNTPLSTLYIGVIDKVSTRREGDNKVTTMVCTEGSIAKKSAPFNRTFVRGDTYHSILLTITAEWQAWGVPLGEIFPTPKIFETIDKDLTLAGTLDGALTTVCNMAGLVWYIVNGNLFVEDKDSNESRPAEAVSINAYNVIDRIEINQDETDSSISTSQAGLQGVKFRTFLNPMLDISKRFKIEYGNFAGLYKVDTITHSLNLDSGDWVTEVEGTPSKYALNKEVSFKQPLIGEFVPSK